MMSVSRAGGVAALLATAALASACATTPQTPPPGSPPPLSLAERMDRTNAAHSDVIEAAGDAVLATGPVARGEVLLRIPYRYRHTAVLTQDVTGFSLTVPGVQVPAGAHGYYAGTFVSNGLSGSGPGDMWCFLRPTDGRQEGPLCLLRNQAAIAAIAPTRMNPWLWSQFGPATGSFNYVNTPIFERRAVEIPGDFVLEYRFDGWDGEAARISEHVQGRKVRDFAVRPPAPLPTLSGHVSIWPDPADPERATIRVAKMDRVEPGATGG